MKQLFSCFSIRLPCPSVTRAMHRGCEGRLSPLTSSTRKQKLQKTLILDQKQRFSTNQMTARLQSQASINCISVMHDAVGSGSTLSSHCPTKWPLSCHLCLVTTQILVLFDATSLHPIIVGLLHVTLAIVVGLVVSQC